MSITKSKIHKETIKLECDGKAISLCDLRNFVKETNHLEGICMVQVEIEESTHLQWAPNTDEDILERSEVRYKTSLTIEQEK